MPFIYPLYVRKDRIEVLRNLMKIASREGRPVSQILLDLAEEYIRKHASGNPGFSLDKWLDNEGFIAFPTLGELWGADKLARLPVDMLRQLQENASYYVTQSKYLLREHEQHQTHIKFGVKVEKCPYCSVGEQ